MLSPNLSRLAAVIWFSLKEVGLGQREASTQERILDHLLDGRKERGRETKGERIKKRGSWRKEEEGEGRRKEKGGGRRKKEEGERRRKEKGGGRRKKEGERRRKEGGGQERGREGNEWQSHCVRNLPPPRCLSMYLRAHLVPAVSDDPVH